MPGSRDPVATTAPKRDQGLSQNRSELKTSLLGVKIGWSVSLLML